MTLGFDVFSACQLVNVNQIERYIFVDKYGGNMTFWCGNCHIVPSCWPATVSAVVFALRFTIFIAFLGSTCELHLRIEQKKNTSLYRLLYVKKTLNRESGTLEQQKIVMINTFTIIKKLIKNKRLVNNV